MDDRIPSQTMAREVAGPRIPAGALGEVLAQGPTLLVFLRHFG